MRYMDADIKESNLLEQIMKCGIPSLDEIYHRLLQLFKIMKNYVTTSVPFSKVQFIDMVLKILHGDFSSFTMLSTPYIRKFDQPYRKLLSKLIRELENFEEYQVLKKADPLALRVSLTSFVLTADQFWLFLQKQALTLDKLLIKIKGSFELFKIIFPRLSPDQFREIMTFAGMDSVKLSDKQFLDDHKNNILMYCVRKTTNFCIVAEFALKQDCLDEMLSQRNRLDQTCFTLACKFDNFGLVKVLLQKYCYNWLRDGYEAILTICRSNNMLIFKYLLGTLKGDSAKTKLDSIRGSQGDSVLMMTTSNTKMMETLLKFARGGQFFNEILHERDALGSSCLFWAALWENVESMKMLIDRYKFDWKADRNLYGYTITHLLCLSKRPDILEYFVSKYGQDFLKVAQLLDYDGCSCLEAACRLGRSVEIVKIVLKHMNDTFILPQHFRQVLRCLVAANGVENENWKEILDCLVIHLLEKLLLRFSEDENIQHCRLYSSDPKVMLKHGVRILVGPTEPNQVECGQPETFSLGSWECVFWAVTKNEEIRILTDQPFCNRSATLKRSGGISTTIFASWECLELLKNLLSENRTPGSYTNSCFKSWSELYEEGFTGLKKQITRKSGNENFADDLKSFVVADIELD